jgi:hypothetical protein
MDVCIIMDQPARCSRVLSQPFYVSPVAGNCPESQTSVQQDLLQPMAICAGALAGKPSALVGQLRPGLIGSVRLFKHRVAKQAPGYLLVCPSGIKIQCLHSDQCQIECERGRTRRS